MLQDWEPPRNWEELAVLLFVALLKALHYMRQRRRGHSHWDSLRPWPKKGPDDAKDQND